MVVGLIPDMDFPEDGLMPKKETRSNHFVNSHPEYDGRGVLIAILDSGVDLSSKHQQLTSTGNPKLVGLYDCTGSGDVDTSRIAKMNASGEIIGLSGRTLKIDSELFKAFADAEFHLGILYSNSIFPSLLRDRMKTEFQEKFQLQYDEAFNISNKALQEHDAKFLAAEIKEYHNRENMNLAVDMLTQKFNKLESKGLTFDCVVFKKGDEWVAFIDTDLKRTISEDKLVRAYTPGDKPSYFGLNTNLSFTVNVHDDGNLLEVVTQASSHGTHVAGISAAYDADDAAHSGVAPGAQIISLKISDTRLDGEETGTSLLRAMTLAAEMGVDIINLSYSEPVAWPNDGVVVRYANELVAKHGISFVVSAMNSGPGLSTCGSLAVASETVSVGAYVSPTMMRAEYAIRKTIPGLCYTWSSRGPADNGALGVSIVGPGAAITSVPSFSLRRYQQMNGTSMSAPHVTGCFALVLSAAKQCGLTITPYSLRRAFENTAYTPPGQDPFAIGYGLAQVDKAWEYLQEHTNYHNVTFDIRVGPRAYAGVLCRSLKSTLQPMNYTVTVAPRFFHKTMDVLEKADFSVRMALVSSHPEIIQIPDSLHVVNMPRSFVVHVEPTLLKPGQILLGEVAAYDVTCPQRGPLFRVPVTVENPLPTFAPYTHSFENVTLTPGEVARHPIQVPLGAAVAKLTAKSHEADLSFHLVVDMTQHLPSHLYKEGRFHKAVDMPAGGVEYTATKKVADGEVIELAMSAYWSIAQAVRVSYKIEFVGVTSVERPLTVSAEKVYPVDVVNHLSAVEVAPTVSLTHLVTPLRPQFPGVISMLTGRRDRLHDGKSPYRLLLTYQFDVRGSVLSVLVCVDEHKPNGSADVAIKCPLLADYLYESEFFGQEFVVYDRHRRVLLVGDAYQYPAMTLTAGCDPYTVQLEVRAPREDILRPLTHLTINLTTKLVAKLEPGVYCSWREAVSGQRKANTFVMVPRTRIRYFVAPIPADKTPLSAKTGSYLTGELFMTAKKDAHCVPAVFNALPSPNRAAKLPAKCDNGDSNDADSTLALNESSAQPNNPTEQDKYDEALLELKLKWMKSLPLDAAKDIYDAACAESTADCYALAKARVKALHEHAERSQCLDEIVRLTDEVISRVDVAEITVELAVKVDLRPEGKASVKRAQERRKDLVDALNYKILALGDSINTINTISDADHREQVIKSLDAAYTDLCRWVNPMTDSACARAAEKHALSRGHYARALSVVLRNKFSAENEKKVIDYTRKLGWGFIADILSDNLLIMAPPSYSVIF